MTQKQALEKIEDLGVELVESKDPSVSILGALILSAPILAAEGEEDLDELIETVFSLVRQKKKQAEAIKNLLA
jgi:hypothetical protein